MILLKKVFLIFLLRQIVLHSRVKTVDLAIREIKSEHFKTQLFQFFDFFKFRNVFRFTFSEESAILVQVVVNLKIIEIIKMTEN